jgi:hypothetical protein
MPPRPVVAVVLAFILGGGRAQVDLDGTLLAFWIAVGVALGIGLTLAQARVAGALYGAGLGFSSTVYGYRGGLLFVERLLEVIAGVAIGAAVGAAVCCLGAFLSARYMPDRRA